MTAVRSPQSISPRERAARMRGRVNAALALAVGSLVAALVGVLLGRSAISEINPLYFQPIEPVRAVDPNAAQAQDGFASAYGWENGQAAMAADCGPYCGSAAYAYPDPPAIRAGGPYWRDPSLTTELSPWPPGRVSTRPPPIERYLHYPIEEGVADAPGAAALKVPDDEVEPAAATSVDPAAEPSEAAPAPDAVE